MRRMHYQIITSALWRFRIEEGKATATEEDKSSTHTKRWPFCCRAPVMHFLKKEKKLQYKAKQRPARPVMFFTIEWDHT